MGHGLFALDNQINNVYGNLRDKMKFDLCIYEALNYTNITMETTFVGMAKINSVMGYKKMMVVRYQTCYTNSTEGTIHIRA